MSTRRLAPPAALAPYVRRLWVLEAERGEAPSADVEHVYPDGSAELVFHRRGRSALGDGRGRFRREPRALLFGQLERSIELRPPRRQQTVGVSFRAAGVKAFFDVPASELTGRWLPLDDVVGARTARVLAARVSEAADASAALDEIVAFLESVRSDRRVDPAVVEAAATIETGYGPLRVEALARAAGIGIRQLQRRFRRDVGLSPRQLGAVVRFDRAVRLARRGGSLIEVAHAAGYYDQSHFIRQFRAFTGESPGRWRRRDERLVRLFSPL